MWPSFGQTNASASVSTVMAVLSEFPRGLNEIIQKEFAQSLGAQSGHVPTALPLILIQRHSTSLFLDGKQKQQELWISCFLTLVILLTLICPLLTVMMYIKVWHVINQVTPATWDIKIHSTQQYFTAYLPWICEHINYQSTVYGTETTGHDHTTTTWK